ncbi:hypothetical protein HanXRQr2_Chr10g0419851 [Helianthus annuus]|uniref:Uncharacterized protein n=1 Tax=Helianthus annuus TaxID=4232 RepID=A0A9K3N375_HELAN|nr:hypothetical protein HanXRQr2_Chr10g0419851 [Helianthus annuus]KAJ0882120.1 hypothetical protein HanPSC8_Chr10g0405981 [Helianthus annuus]
MLFCVLGFAYYIHETTNVYASWNPIVAGVDGCSHRYQHHCPSLTKPIPPKASLFSNLQP